jgi:hypothetical protein
MNADELRRAREAAYAQADAKLAREPSQDEMGATERAAIVAWLRAQSDVYSSAGHHGLAVDWRMAADAIEAGEHRSER